jgi:glycosyltransferase involved in cell wall biosynthesis
MKVLAVHNRYQMRGGEDTVFDSEVLLLAAAGAAVTTFVVTNDKITGVGSRISSFLQAPYNLLSYRKFARILAAEKPDVVHVHNFFPLLTPAIFDVCRSQRVAVVFTLHNFRITCANGLLFRDGKPCRLCINGSPYSAVLYRCYRGSLLGSLAVANMIALHRWRGTWRRSVNRFIALSEFGRDHFISAGVPGSLIKIKPNFVHDRAGASDDNSNREGILYVGRLSPEKGIGVLLDAWKRMSVPLTIVGSGPLEPAVRAMQTPAVKFLGPLEAAEVTALMKRSRFLVVPSVCYEQLPMVVIEAFAAGLPVIASRIGSLEYLVSDARTGYHFQAGNALDLANVATKAMSLPKPASLLLGQEARATYLSYYTPERNLRLLLEIYQEARDDAESR